MAGGIIASLPSAHVNPDIFKLEQKRKPVLLHETGAGAPCRNCNCTGLDLHYWRKICKVCSCRMEDHNIVLEHDHGDIIIRKLFADRSLMDTPVFSALSHGLSNMGIDHGKREHVQAQRQKPIYNVTVEQRVPTESGRRTSATTTTNRTTYAWLPTGDVELAERYMEALPEEERTIAGSEGAKRRQQRLASQLPLYDSHADHAKSLATENDRELHDRFVQTLQNEVAGVGEVVEMDMASWRTNTVNNNSNNVNNNNNNNGHHHHNGTEGRRILTEDTTCQYCRKSLRRGDIGVTTSHGDHTEAWHPNCFRCCTCNQLLADLLYFFKDGKYYCGRHFGDTVYPRCAGCDELIFAKEYTRAEDKDWHFNHFCCFGCDKELGGHRYMAKHDQPFCFDCYMKKFARTCHSCQVKIEPDQQRITHKEMHWHATPACFQCRNCSAALINQRFVLKGDNIYCSAECKRDHYDHRHRPAADLK